MSTARRIASGTVATWARLGVSIAGQLLLIPILLSNWDAATLGLWITLQAMAVLLTILDIGHHTFVGYELMKVSPDHTGEFSRLLWSAVPPVFIFASVGLSLSILVPASGALGPLLGDAEAIQASAAAALVIQATGWLLGGAFGGLMTRAIVPFGYYAQTTWWGVAIAIVSVAAPALAVSLGAEIIGAVMVTNLATTSVFVAFDVYCMRLLKSKGVLLAAPDLALGTRNALLSVGLSARDLLAQARQQGVRLILAPIVGVTRLADFATIRTAANLMMQGLSAVTGPIEPELLRFIRQRDQDGISAALGSVWIIVIAVLAPVTLAAQALFIDVFPIWTRGKIVFDPLLFGVFSAGVLVMALAQAAVTVVSSQNLVKAQLKAALAIATVVIGGVVMATPRFGLIGAAWALLVGEVLSLVIFVSLARRWLSANGLALPGRLLGIAAGAVAISIAGLLISNISPYSRVWCLTAAAFVDFALLYPFWLSLPRSVRERLGRIITATRAVVPTRRMSNFFPAKHLEDNND